MAQRSLEKSDNIPAVSTKKPTLAELEIQKKALETVESTPENILKKKNLMKSIWQSQLHNMQTTGTDIEKNILKNRKEFDNIRHVDILAMKNAGTPLYEYLLVDKNGGFWPVKSTDLVPTKEFEVNFGSNTYMKSSLGAGDILPPEVSEVEINGKKWVRKEYPRPGYYVVEWKKSMYLPVYDGDSIKVVSTRVISDSEKQNTKDIHDEYYRKQLIQEYIRIEKSGEDPKQILNYISTEDMIDIQRDAQEEKVHTKARLERESPVNGRVEFLSRYGAYLNDICKKLNIPPSIMMTIYEKESNFRMIRNTAGSSASGIWQITDDTWIDIQNKILPSFDISGKTLNRASIEDNILASTALLAGHRRTANGNLHTAIGYYVTGAGTPTDDIWEKMKTQNISRITMYMREDLRNSKIPTPEALAEFRKCAVEKHLGFWPDVVGTQYVALDIPPIPTMKIEDIWSRPSISSGGMTYCSRTARENGNMFGVELPGGASAKDAWSVYTADSEHVMKDFLNPPSKANFADIILTSNTENGKKYGHRAVAFLVDSSWYVLDPYNGAKQATLLSTYSANYTAGNGGRIEKVGFYEVDKDDVNPRLARTMGLI